MKPARAKGVRLKGPRPVCPKCGSAAARRCDLGPERMTCERCGHEAKATTFRHREIHREWPYERLPSAGGYVLPVYPLDD